MENICLIMYVLTDYLTFLCVTLRLQLFYDGDS